MRKIIMLLDNDFKSDNRVEKEATSLINNNYSVTVVCLQNPSLPKQEIRNGMLIIRCIDPALYSHPFSKKAIQGSKTLTAFLLNETFDILHCHDFNLIHIGSALKQRGKNVKVVYDSHEFLKKYPMHENVKLPFNRLKAFIVWKLLLIREKKAAKYYDAFLTTTEIIAQKLSQHLAINLYTYLRNIPETQNIVPSNYLKNTFGLPLDSILIIHSGNIYFQPELLVDIYKGIQNCGKNIFLAFFIAPDRSQKFKKFVDEQGMSSVIFFHDYPQKENIIQYLASANIGFSWVNPAFMSQVYTSANRFWEYSLAELPVLSNYQWEICREIENKQNGVVYTIDQVGFQNALHTILDNYNHFKKNAIATAKNDSWEKESLKLIALYDALYR